MIGFATAYGWMSLFNRHSICPRACDCKNVEAAIGKWSKHYLVVVPDFPLVVMTTAKLQ